MKTTLIGIAGGSASGKSSVSKKVYEASSSYGSVAIIKMDDYYKKLDNLTMEERASINYDHPNSFDVDLLVSNLNDLKNGKPIDKPIYDFTIHNRKQETELILPSNVVIVEGILIFAIPEIRDLFDIKLFVDTPDDIRFIRRLKRDVKKRGRDVESVINQYLTTVRPMHHLFVEPSKQYADIIVPEGGKNVVAVDFIVTKILQLLNEKN